MNKEKESIPILEEVIKRSRKNIKKIQKRINECIREIELIKQR